ncbi:hypothetical protein BX616_001004 [Lobosporangium transversale]|uniref:F-box domain-containing protein n=1 Tax=Lobosporangium transversale TaxID=64571 RepID=A0A1Y2G9M2_9FUNG|nr:hypothetical protein BCR41DRAFT_362338 [Lobosporangium transversale]KAF9905514.1 hypothetical protein BX616_001004 [Lobosporangium transversale]ORZ04859.1 hypothetical protein BCR41DRAFT_362338 [Lobosporangium transversale]|eukprot:XP_021876796.1 hypothetical protein BCR41DRAFT_362338 [Lobosporangium transversale]
MISFTVTLDSLDKEHKVYHLRFNQECPLPPSTLSVGWSNLPTECLELIVTFLDHDSGSLATLARVNRQCFFLVIPRLYNDAFQRVRDITQQRSSNIKLSLQTNSITVGLPPAFCLWTASMDLLSSATQEDAIKIRHHYENHMIDFNKIAFYEQQTRETLLLCTLLSPLVQGLSARFPALSKHFSSPQWRFNHSSYQGFPHPISWRSQHYLRHLVVLDLERLCTRGSSRLSLGEAAAIQTGKTGMFPLRFAPFRWEKELRSVGVLDYLQRALLNQPGADRIRCLRIPIHRMRTYQQRHERAPRKGRTRSRTGQAREENEGQTNRDETSLIGHSLTSAELSRTTEESQRPYCFTFKKLTKLRRLEVCYMTNNQCDWDTLERVLSTLQFGNHLGIHPDEIVEATAGGEEGRPKNNSSHPLHQIREFSLQAQSLLGDRFVNILRFFEKLEALELRSSRYDQRAWISQWDPKLCRNLKVLWMGPMSLNIENAGSYEALGRLINLEELRFSIDRPIEFQQVLDAKVAMSRRFKEEKLRSSSTDQGEHGKSSSIIDDDYDRRVSHGYLPRLKRLGLSIQQMAQMDIANSVIAAFGHQLEEFVLYSSSYLEPPHRFNHMFLQLTRLALRGHFVREFDFTSLSQQCPSLEMLALQHSCNAWTVGPSPNDGNMLDALIQLKRLRCLYLEGIWFLNDEQFLYLAQTCQSLCLIRVHNSVNLTPKGAEAADTILSSRPTKYPLKCKGVYRLAKTMTEFFGDECLWRVRFFGYEDDI